MQPCHGVLIMFFFSTHGLMYKKSNSFVYKFAVKYQVFEITPSRCILWSWKLACLITWTILLETPFLDICRCAFKRLNMPFWSMLLYIWKKYKINLWYKKLTTKLVVSHSRKKLRALKSFYLKKKLCSSLLLEISSSKRSAKFF